MAGLFSYGARLEVKTCLLPTLAPGDVIVFRNLLKERGPDLIVHRVVARKDDGLITRGDNSGRNDCFPVVGKNLIGRVVSFEYKGKVRGVRGGWSGLAFANIKRITRRARSRLYKTILSLPMMKRCGRYVLESFSGRIRELHLASRRGEIVKWVLNGRVIARKDPNRDASFVKPPFELLLGYPYEDGESQEAGAG